MAKSPLPPQPTEFERLIPRRRPYIEAARFYVQRHGQSGAQDAILRDMRAGRLPRHKAEHMIGYLLFLLIERICRRIGYTRYGALLLDLEFLSEIAAELDAQDRLQGPFSKQQREQFATQAASDALNNWHYVAQALAGNPIYSVTPTLAQSLREPPPQDLACATLRLPVPALVLLVPPEAGLTLEYEGQHHRVTELYAVEAPAPERRWFLWICAPMDEQAVATEYLNVGLSADETLEHSLKETRAAHANSADPSSSQWPRCVRFMARAMLYLSEGGFHKEQWLGMDAGRRIVLGTQT